ncbi:hypothetical protein MAJ_03379, partial [Metarhizium majus ARSEF 297]
MPEEPLLAELLEQQGATVTFNREDVIKVVRDIQDSRHRLMLLVQAVGAPQDSLWGDDAHPSTKRSSVAQNHSSGEVSSDISTHKSTSSNSESIDGEEPTPDEEAVLV